MFSEMWASQSMLFAFSFALSCHEPKTPLSPQPSQLPSRIPLPKKPTEAKAANASGAARFTRLWLPKCGSSLGCHSIAISLRKFWRLVEAKCDSFCT